MNRANRRRLNLLAIAIEGGAERLVTWLRAKAKRQPRPRPLAFPTPMEEMLDRLYAPMIHRMAEQAVQDILGSGVSMVKIVSTDGDGIVFSRIPPASRIRRPPADNRRYAPDWMNYL